jgi:hypothetical protein
MLCSAFFIKAQPFSDTKIPVYIYAGLMNANLETRALFDASIPGVNSELELEDDLDFSSKAAFPFIKIIPGRAFQVSAAYTRLHRKGESELVRQFAFGDSVYSVGATIKGYFNTDYYSLNLLYSFIRSKKASAGVSLGFRYLRLNAGIEATSYGQVFKRDGSFSVPVALPGVQLSFYLLPNTLVRGSFEYLSLSFKETNGYFTEAQASVEQYILKFLGAGVGYSFNRIKAEGIPENPVYLQDVKYEWKGLTFFAALRF